MERNNELQHYGVLGMKWGVRRARKAAESGNSDKARELYSKHYAKASAKVNKLNKKAADKNLKAAKLQKKALTKETKATNEKQFQKARQQLFKANTQKLKSAKLEKKAMKFEKKMEKTFGGVKLSDVSRESVASGKKYAYMLLNE